MRRVQVEVKSLDDVMAAIKAALKEQRARVFVFYTDAHRKLSASHDTFQFAMSQADHCYASDKQSGTPFVSQKELLDHLATLSREVGSKVLLLAGPSREARTLARKLETSHHGFSGVVPVQFPDNYDHDESLTGHVIEAINAASPDIVLMASGLLAQETWIANYRHRLNCSVVIGLHSLA